MKKYNVVMVIETSLKEDRVKDDLIDAINSSEGYSNFDVLSVEIEKFVFRPKVGQQYCTFNLLWDEPFIAVWGENECNDISRYENKLVFETEEEALECLAKIKGVI